MPLPSLCRNSERPKAAVLGRPRCRPLSAVPLRRRLSPPGGPESSNCKSTAVLLRACNKTLTGTYRYNLSLVVLASLVQECQADFRYE